MSKKDKNKKPDLKLVSDKVKITKIPKAKDQPLTSKQLEFAQLIADGFTKAEAFRKAYDVSPDTKEKSIHEMASKTFNNVKVISRVKAIQHQKAEDQRMLGIKQNINMTADELEDQLKDKLQKLLGNN